MATGDRIRRLVALEAARLMYVDGVHEYRDAKRKAAKRFGTGTPLALGSHLPSNAEIHACILTLIENDKDASPPSRLLAMRLVVLKQMELLEPFHPYLVGSVLSGAVTSRSDIDLHLFAGSPEEVEEYLRGKGVPFQEEVVSIRHGGEFKEYPHIYIYDMVVVECTVYPLDQMRNIPRSSVTGKPMQRAGTGKLRKMIAAMTEEGMAEL